MIVFRDYEDDGFSFGLGQLFSETLLVSSMLSSKDGFARQAYPFLGRIKV
jgi:hypothetical protein